MALSRDLLEDLRRLLRPIQTRIANSIARAVVQLVDDETKLQILQLGVLADETVDDCERFQEYGFFSVPLTGAEAVVVFPNGDRGHPLVVAVDDRRYRPTGGDPGESGLYCHAGAVVRLTADGDVVVTPAGGRAVLLGGSAAADPVALKSDLDALKSAIDGWTPVPNDGGAALKTALTALFAAWPTGAEKVKAE